MSRPLVEQLTEKQKFEVQALMSRDGISDFVEGTRRYLAEKGFIKGA